MPYYSDATGMIIKTKTEELATRVADWLIGYANEVIERQGRFAIALSGGSTPKALHTLLAAEPYRSQTDWSAWQVFWGDERAVPFDDDRNNARMAYETLLNHVPVPPAQIHVMRTDLEPIEAATEYAYTLHSLFDGQPHTFDLVLLGMGDDGHTLSLFPGQDVVHEQHAWTSAFWLASQDMYRITLTAPVVNQAACVAFLVAGAGKAETLKAVLEGPYVPDQYPSQVIKPADGQLIWFIDEAAGALL